MNDPSAPEVSEPARRVHDAVTLIRSLDLPSEGASLAACVASAKLIVLLGRLEADEIITVVDLLKSNEGEERSIALYRLWLSLPETSATQTFAAWYNLGVELFAAGRYAEAAPAFLSAKVRKGDLYQASINLGLAFEKTGQPELALRAWRDALQADETRVTLLNYRARLLERLKRFDEAEQLLAVSLATNPDQPKVIHHWVGLRTTICAWPIYAGARFGLTEKDLIEATSAITLLAMFDDIDLQRRLNAKFIAANYPDPQTRLSPEDGYKHDKIRVGYLSSDFCKHPIAYLVAELFELHDRDRFEIYGYCATNDDGSETRKRVVAAFDRFRPIGDLSDEAVARMIAADAIDILVDLNGLTYGSRLSVLRWRPAPVQVTYLGYNGPIPLPELDYILADRFVIPPSAAYRYSPAPLFLPGCYQVNDNHLDIAGDQTREVAGLPADAFVFCCISSSFKITETMFDAWMDILLKVDRAVLWLSADNATVRKNISERAQRRGVSPDRLLFTERMDTPIYRARLALADLFLDTYPYNAGVTASDALRVGLPLITIAGESFIARMAGSLLTTVGLQEGIVSSLAAYVDLAVALATDGEKYRRFRARLDGGVWRRTLGDTARFTIDLEDVYRSIVRDPG